MGKDRTEREIKGEYAEIKSELGDSSVLSVILRKTTLDVSQSKSLTPSTAVIILSLEQIPIMTDHSP